MSDIDSDIEDSSSQYAYQLGLNRWQDAGNLVRRYAPIN